MPIEKAPFVRTKLDEELTQRDDTFTIRLNSRERELLEFIKRDFDIKSDGQALKESAWVGLNVLHGVFGASLTKYLFKKERSRLSDYEDIWKRYK